MHDAASWVKTAGKCRYSDGSTFDLMFKIVDTDHDGCAQLCIAYDSYGCDAFEVNNGYEEKKLIILCIFVVPSGYIYDNYCI